MLGKLSETMTVYCSLAHITVYIGE